ncbi:MAG: response regulator [Chitinophagaceae bacterium]|nr:MAG: response regulator [Chitinophagaceae bacterium]
MNNRKLRVLVVEDEMIQSLYLKKTLTALGYEVIDCITTGEDAVLSAIENKPDFITMDIQLSDDIDGIDATHEIQKKVPIPVIYITGNTDHLHTTRLQSTYYLDLLAKPASRGQILNALNKFKPAFGVNGQAMAVS